MRLPKASSRRVADSLVAPCCHQELRPQLRPPPVLAGALRHGILLEREAGVCHGRVAGCVCSNGPDTTPGCSSSFSTEHTSKNLMNAATKRAIPATAMKLRRRAKELAALLLESERNDLVRNSI